MKSEQLNYFAFKTPFASSFHDEDYAFEISLY